MANLLGDPIERFAHAAEEFCSWASCKLPAPENDLSVVCQLLADLVASGCGLGWSEGEPSETDFEPAELNIIKARASSLPFQYYSEIFNSLVVPAEAPVTGDLMDDLIDIYRDLAPGLALYRGGKRQEAADHWQFWFVNHWGEHATSALRAVWSFLARCEGSESYNGS